MMRCLRIALCCLAAALLVQPATCPAAGKLGLEAPEGVAPLLRRHLSVLAGDHSGALGDGTDRLALLRRTRREVEGLLATEGYFSPRVSLEPAGEDWRLVVLPGQRATISSVKLRLRPDNVLGEGERRDWLDRMSQAWPLGEGEPFTQAAWDRGKAGLVELMAGRVFATARISESRAEVDPERATVALTVELDPGPRFYIGDLKVEGLHDYDPDLVSRYRPPKAGTPYDEDRLLSFQTALQNTPYFASAVVDIDRDPANASATPLRVLVSEAKPRRTTLGGGFSSNTGYRAETGYRDANLFGRAWQLVSGLRIEQKEMLLFGDVFLPPALAGYRDSFGALHERSDVEGLKLARSAVGVTRSYPIPKGEFSLSVRYQRERTEPAGAETSRQNALTGDAAVVWREVDNLLDPRRGFIATARLGGAGKALLSDQNFVRALARLQLYFPVGERDVLSLRGEVGKTFATSRDGIPQDFLFRAGGSLSVRGYAYRSLGVQQGDATVGGRYLATGSAEYTHWRSDGWGLAGFADAGNATDDLQAFRPLLGVGGGVRWKSPAGPLALDLAWGHEDRKLRLHFSILVAY